MRNFYNSSVVLRKLDFSKDILDTSINPKVHLDFLGCDFEQKGRVVQISNNPGTTQESYIKLGKLINYAAIDLDIQRQTHKWGMTSALLSFYKHDGNRFLITQGDIDSKNKKLTLDAFKNGEQLFYQALSEDGVTAPNTLRVHLTGKFLNVLLVKNEELTVLGSFEVSEYFELRDKSILEQFSLRVGARLGSGASLSISKLEQYLTCGTAQADPKVLHYEDGSPIIEGNEILVVMTTKRYGT